MRAWLFTFLVVSSRGESFYGKNSQLLVVAFRGVVVELFLVELCLVEFCLVELLLSALKQLNKINYVIAG